MLRLRVSPQAVVHNATHVALTLEIQDGPAVIVKPQCQLPFDWRPLLRPPQKFTLMHSTPGQDERVTCQNCMCRIFRPPVSYQEFALFLSYVNL
jgi:hypothetical protein